MEKSLNLPKILMDEYNIRILSATTFQARSARELSYMFGIPLASCYRKINELEKAGFLKAESRELTREGKRYNTYKSQVGSINIFFENLRIAGVVVGVDEEDFGLLILLCSAVDGLIVVTLYPDSIRIVGVFGYFVYGVTEVVILPDGTFHAVLEVILVNRAFELNTAFFTDFSC